MILERAKYLNNKMNACCHHKTTSLPFTFKQVHYNEVFLPHENEKLTLADFPMYDGNRFSFRLNPISTYSYLSSRSH